MTALNFSDPEFAQRYVEGPGQFVPGYETMQRMAAQLLAERAGEAARILVLGAGGGLELEAFAGLQPSWRFVGLDPSDEMLALARARVAAAGAADRVDWMQGYIPDAPAGPFDGATCLLTLHFVADDGAKLEALRAIRERLAPGGPFALVDLCMDKAGSDFAKRLDRYARFALDSGAEAQDVADTRARLVDVLHMITPEREEALLRQAGFTDLDVFYAGHSWRGWIGYA